MLKLSKKIEYDLMVAKYMVLNNGAGFSTAKEIAEGYKIPYQLVVKVLLKLAKSNIAVSSEGVNGGFNLAKKTGKYFAYRNHKCC